MAVVYFYPLSGCARFLSQMDLEGYRCSLVAVDRPCCGATSAALDLTCKQPHETPAMDSEVGCCRSSATIHPKHDDTLRRIEGHAKDVLEVLMFENIQKVYILRVCIGHPYAIEVCRQLPPFVSTMCPQSWHVA